MVSNQKILEVSQRRMARETESTREKMHISIWTRFMASSKQAALHMDPSYEKNLELFESPEFESMKGLFGVTRMMIEGNSEIKNVFPADVASSLLVKTVLLKEQPTKWTNLECTSIRTPCYAWENSTVQKMQ